ncbi:MAG: DUF1801 domain-containing protein [Chloroflexi bacterium]|nr:DUF1801 domain-containing protein [Chloroflexota bacterium]
MANEKTVDGFILALDGWQKEVVATIRELVQQAAPQAEEAFKWAQPVWSQLGPFAYVKAFKNHVNFGFWRGADLKDPHGLLQGSGTKMCHVKLTSLEDIKPDAFQDFVRQAVELNQTKGDPTK